MLNGAIISNTLSVIMLSVIMLSVIIVSVLAQEQKPKLFVPNFHIKLGHPAAKQ